MFLTQTKADFQMSETRKGMGQSTQFLLDFKTSKAIVNADMLLSFRFRQCKHSNHSLPPFSLFLKGLMIWVFSSSLSFSFFENYSQFTLNFLHTWIFFVLTSGSTSIIAKSFFLHLKVLSNTKPRIYIIF